MSDNYQRGYIKIDQPAPEMIALCVKLQGLRMQEGGVKVSIQDIYKEVWEAGCRDLFDRQNVLK